MADAILGVVHDDNCGISRPNRSCKFYFVTWREGGLQPFDDTILAAAVQTGVASAEFEVLRITPKTPLALAALRAASWPEEKVWAQWALTMAKVIGIDLGTTNSCVAVMLGGRPRVLANSEGERTTPSIVAFNKDGRHLIGESARRQAVTNPDDTIFAVKRLMGRRFEDPIIQKRISLAPYKIVKGKNGDAWVSAGGKDYSAFEVSGYILQKMKQTAEHYLGESVSQAVVTVPAYFDDAQRQATKDAGQIAGLEVVKVINEPTAAALAYGFGKSFRKTIAVYDLGGGTFDISVLEIEDGVFEVKSTNGHTFLGGDDLDAKLVVYLADKFEAKNGLDLQTDRLALQRLQEAAKKAKIELSSAHTAEIILPFIAVRLHGGATLPLHLAETITRTDLENLVEDQLALTLELCRKALADAGLKASDIDEVVLVGGMTRMPKVRDAVAVFFARPVLNQINPEEAPALGAAIQAGILQGEVKDTIPLDISPYAYGFLSAHGTYTSFDLRNATIPTRLTTIVSVRCDGSNFDPVWVFQETSEERSEGTILGMIIFDKNKLSGRRDYEIGATIEVTGHGNMTMSWKDCASGYEIYSTYRPLNALTALELSRFPVKNRSLQLISKKRHEQPTPNKAWWQLFSRNT
jgi:molecular chaperone DnaK